VTTNATEATTGVEECEEGFVATGGGWTATAPGTNSVNILESAPVSGAPKRWSVRGLSSAAGAGYSFRVWVSCVREA
jgi:hypothetical protein